MSPSAAATAGSSAVHAATHAVKSLSSVQVASLEKRGVIKDTGIHLKEGNVELYQKQINHVTVLLAYAPDDPKGLHAVTQDEIEEFVKKYPDYFPWSDNSDIHSLQFPAHHVTGSSPAPSGREFITYKEQENTNHIILISDTHVTNSVPTDADNKAFAASDYSIANVSKGRWRKLDEGVWTKDGKLWVFHPYYAVKNDDKTYVFYSDNHGKAYTLVRVVTQTATPYNDK